MIETSPFQAPVTAETLAGIGLFGALDTGVLSQLAASLETVTLNPGVFVFREGEPSSHVYVVLQGELEVLKRSREGVDARVSVLGNGDWFGEMSILDLQPRSASIRTLASCRLLVFSRSDLDVLYRSDAKSYSLLVLNMARELCRRLRVADGVLADLIVPPATWPRRLKRGVAI